jgi:hypothetical protein
VNPPTQSLIASVNRLAGAFALLLALGLAAAADSRAAVGPVGDPRAASSTGYDVHGTAAAFRPRDGGLALFVWSADSPSETNREHIYGRFVGSDGTPIGSQFLISTVDADAAQFQGDGGPDVAYNPARDEFLVAWYSDEETAEAYGVYARVVSPPDESGVAELGSTVTVREPNGLFRPNPPAIAYNESSSEYLVAYNVTDRRPGFEDAPTAMWGRRLDSLGRTIAGAPAFRIADELDAPEVGLSHPAIGVANDGGYVLLFDLFQRFGANPDRAELRSQHLTASGAQPEDSTILAGPTTSGFRDEAIAVDPESGIFMATYTGSATVFARPLGPDGKPIGIPATPLSTGIPSYSAIEYNPSGREFLVSWLSGFAGSGWSEVLGRRVDLGGQALGTQFEIAEAIDYPGSGGTGNVFGPIAQVFSPNTHSFLVGLPAGPAGEHRAWVRRVQGNRLPTAAFGVSPQAPVAGEKVTFTSTSKDTGEGTIAEFRWDIDGDGLYGDVAGNPAVVERTFAAPGTYEVGLVIVDDDGGQDEKRVQVTVGPAPTGPAQGGDTTPGGSPPAGGSPDNGPAPDLAAPALRIAGKPVRVTKDGLARIRLSCPSSEASGPCSGELRLRGRVRMQVGRHSKLRWIAFGKSVEYSISPARSKVIGIALNKLALDLIGEASYGTRASTEVSDARGNEALVSKDLVLRGRAGGGG